MLRHRPSKELAPHHHLAGDEPTSALDSLLGNIPPERWTQLGEVITPVHLDKTQTEIPLVRPVIEICSEEREPTPGSLTPPQALAD